MEWQKENSRNGTVPNRDSPDDKERESTRVAMQPNIKIPLSDIVFSSSLFVVGEDGQWDEASGTVTENNRTSYQVTGLQPFIVYSFRVAAVNALGKSPPSKESYYIVTLREIPDGKPTITAAQNASSTSIRLAWRPPQRHTIHGEFIGYRLAFRPRDKGVDSIQEIYLRDPNIESYIIQKLMTFTQYLVSLQVFNPEGLGPPTTVAVITDEGGK
ncbi:Protein sidekick-2 [Folsomia candida]|uniref:Protein sidekick-2 n=1 Tax=Folsomia candida TaxID=158441 RepID=A0A226E3X6_FOLCA|nr:Protein sidekick-2 [Folsomia candida]